MKLVVTGGTGFTGERVVRLLTREGNAVTVLARPSADVRGVIAAGARVARGDLDQPRSLPAAFAGADALLYVASMGSGHMPATMAAAVSTGIRRVVCVSSTALLTNLPVRSKPMRMEGERCVRESGLEWTIIRPTMIYGSARDRNMCRLLRHMATWRVAPLPSGGRALQQPVHVDDVAATIVAATRAPMSIGRDYNISGARPMTLRQIIIHAAAAVGTSPIFLPLPATATSRALSFLERHGLRLPICAEQIDRLNEDKAFDHAAVTSDLDVVPRCFSVGIRQEAIELGYAPKGT
jgi:uncharacterized protein YbjT (DUF2867 family)